MPAVTETVNGTVTLRLAQQFQVIAGKTPGGNVRVLNVDSDGSLYVNNLLNVLQKLFLAGNAEVTTAVVDATYTALADQACGEVQFFNYSGVDLQLIQDGAGVAITIPNNAITLIDGITDASQLSVRRKTGTGQVTCQYRWKGAIQWRSFSPAGYVLDSNGNPVLDSDGQPILSS